MRVFCFCFFKGSAVIFGGAAIWQYERIRARISSTLLPSWQPEKRGELRRQVRIITKTEWEKHKSYKNNVIITSITRALRDMLGWVCLRKELR